MKAALRSSLAYWPKLRVLDEPSSGLDSLVRDEFIRGVREVSALGEWTVLMSAHDIDEVERLADHVAMIEGGRATPEAAIETVLGAARGRAGAGDRVYADGAGEGGCVVCRVVGGDAGAVGAAGEIDCADDREGCDGGERDAGAGAEGADAG